MGDCKITVLMSVYNGEEFLREAVESILSQTLEDFEFLIIDDGSSDSSAEIINSFDDPRIKLVINKFNIGLARSLNRGLLLSSGEFIARMDADDISAASRFEKQIRFLEQHPEIDVCGSYISAFTNESKRIWTYPTDPLEATCYLLFNAPVAHPVVMVRKESLQRHNLLYDPAYQAAQDYDLWARAIGLMQIANIEEVLLEYRLHDNQIGRSGSGFQSKAANTVRLRLLKRLSLEPTAEELDVHNRVGLNKPEVSKEWLITAGTWLGKLYRANLNERVFPVHCFSRKLAQYWLDICHANRGYGLWTAVRYFCSPLARVNSIDIRTKLALTRQCISPDE